MDLEPEQSLRCAPLHIVVDEDRGDVAVDDVDERVAARDQVDRVPFTRLDQPLQLVGGAFEIANDLRLGVRSDVDRLSAHHDDAAAALLVDHAGELVGEVDVGLVALEHPFAGDRSGWG